MLSPTEYIDFALDRLRRRGDRITVERRTLIGLLATLEEPLSAYGLRDSLEGATEPLHVVTIYRILEALERAGLVHRVGDTSGYLPCRLGDHPGIHYHLVCRACGRVQEVASRELAAELVTAGSGPAAREQFQVRSYSISCAGVCRRCGSEVAVLPDP
jgi:Fur family zinc uptake transcriptional regulator